MGTGKSPRVVAVFYLAVPRFDRILPAPYNSVLEIDGADTKGMTQADLASLLLGPAGQPSELFIQSPGQRPRHVMVHRHVDDPADLCFFIPETLVHGVVRWSLVCAQAHTNPAQAKASEPKTSFFRKKGAAIDPLASITSAPPTASRAPQAPDTEMYQVCTTLAQTAPLPHPFDVYRSPPHPIGRDMC